MTIRELLDAVCRLGFQTQPEEEWEDSFYKAVNHALCEIRRVLPEYATVKLSHYPVTPVSVITNQSIGKEGYSYSASDAGAIEISLSGYADLELSSAAGRLVVERIGCPMPGVSVHRYLVRDLIPEGGSDDVTITLVRSGACRASIRYWAAGEIDSLDLPEEAEGYTVYDLSKLYGDFGSLQKVRKEGCAKIDYRFAQKTKLALRTDEPGEYTVIYRKSVPQMDKERSREIPLSDDEGDLMTLLVAAYVLLDENDGKSNWYRDRYQEQLAFLLRQRRPVREPAFKDVYNW